MTTRTIDGGSGRRTAFRSAASATGMAKLIALIRILRARGASA
jgi:hypothetical protein